LDPCSSASLQLGHLRREKPQAIQPHAKRGGGNMYFMNICTWDPKDEKKVTERRKKWKWPDKVKVLFEFLDLQGCRVINVIDTDEKGLIASRSEWVDILKFETFPVYPIGDTKKKLSLK
jgi:hypothetical protein